MNELLCIILTLCQKSISGLPVFLLAEKLPLRPKQLTINIEVRVN